MSHRKDSRNTKHRRVSSAPINRRRSDITLKRVPSTVVIPPPAPPTPFKKRQPYDWGAHLDKTNEEAAPVSSFKHCRTPGWSDLELGMNVEVPVPRADRESDEIVYWQCTMIKFAGYKVKLRYIGCGADGSKDFWHSLCVHDVHSIAWCAAHKQKLVPPLSIQSLRQNWGDYLVKQITRKYTLLEAFYHQFLDHLGKHKFIKGMILEVVDKNCVAAMRVAKITNIVESRLHLQYVHIVDTHHDMSVFCCHKDSSLIHPIGWASHVGHRLSASEEYMKTCHTRYMLKKPALYEYPNDCTADMFTNDVARSLVPTSKGKGFAVGMKLEVVDPLNLVRICPATVVKLLKDGYMMVGLDDAERRFNEDEYFCYHVTSACILPVDYCFVNDIELSPPRGYQGTFLWKDHLKATGSNPAPLGLFTTKVPPHSFKKGMKVEAVDLIDPVLICTATIARVVGRLMRVHFDGWEDSFDQWMDVESPEVYPIGWCELMDYKLHTPGTR